MKNKGPLNATGLVNTPLLHPWHFRGEVMAPAQSCYFFPTPGQDFGDELRPEWGKKRLLGGPVSVTKHWTLFWWKGEGHSWIWVRKVTLSQVKEWVQREKGEQDWGQEATWVIHVIEKRASTRLVTARRDMSLKIWDLRGWIVRCQRLSKCHG